MMFVGIVEAGAAEPARIFDDVPLKTAGADAGGARRRGAARAGRPAAGSASSSDADVARPVDGSASDASSDGARSEPKEPGVKSRSR